MQHCFLAHLSLIGAGPSVGFIRATNSSCSQGTWRLFSHGLQKQKHIWLLRPRSDAPSARPRVLGVATHNALSAAESRRRPVADMVKARDMEWRSTAQNWRNLPKHYMQLSKVRLTGLVVVTAVAGYAMAPGVFSAGTLALVATGTLLTSAAANTVNQWLEIPYDSQMARTAARPLVRHQVSPLHALTLAGTCVCSGVGLLSLASPLAAALGAANFLLYTAVYTPLKRVTIANTWVGAVVGGVPPLIGWAAATGSLAPGAWLLAALLYAWQFPHFNALSWNLRKDYARAGYRIMAVTHPDLTRRVALRYSLLLAVLPTLTSACDVTTWMYAVDSLPVNAYLIYLSWRFYRERESSSARRLTRFSYVQLTAGLILMLMAKQHYHSEPERRGHRGLADWCVGGPLLHHGWNLGGLLAVAERREMVSAVTAPAPDSHLTPCPAPSLEECVLTAERYVPAQAKEGGL